MESAVSTIWPAWRRVIFRFFFIYIALFIEPWSWVDFFHWYADFSEWGATILNQHLFHIKKELVFDGMGSGDTSYEWTKTMMNALLSLVGVVVWSAFDQSRNYTRLNYWLRLFIRYYIALNAFNYGIIKLFALQMPFPNLSQMATPLGDFLPMRLSWMFIGYSTSYQVFSGVMEVMVGALLLYRRTATLGTILATAVFTNVMMLNLCYDVPVKLFSMHLVVLCLVLLVNEMHRIVCFFILNRPAPVCSVYDIRLTKKWMCVGRVIVKLLFVYRAVVATFMNSYDYYQTSNHPAQLKQISTGLYDVTLFALRCNNQAGADTAALRWQNVVFDKGGAGSIKTSDKLFRQRYGRGYFDFEIDSVKQSISFRKNAYDDSSVMMLHYNLPDAGTIYLSGKRLDDSIFVTLKRNSHSYQLAEKQFHWISEANR